MVTGSFWRLEERNVISILKKGRVGETKELQARQAHISPLAENGAANFGKHFWAY